MSKVWQVLSSTTLGWCPIVSRIACLRLTSSLPAPPMPPPPAQVHLNMFQYFMFWAAFYVLRTSSRKQSDAR